MKLFEWSGFERFWNIDHSMTTRRQPSHTVIFNICSFKYYYCHVFTDSTIHVKNNTVNSCLLMRRNCKYVHIWYLVVCYMNKNKFYTHFTSFTYMIHMSYDCMYTVNGTKIIPKLCKCRKTLWILVILKILLFFYYLFCCCVVVPSVQIKDTNKISECCLLLGSVLLIVVLSQLLVVWKNNIVMCVQKPKLSHAGTK